MPNWCQNNATFSHKNVEMMKKLIKAANGDHALFDSFVPMPEELRNTVSPSPSNESLVEKYGASDWYQWAVNNWGTKWDVSVDSCDVSENDKGDPVSATLWFDTAWSPPIEFYNSMTELGFEIDATYTEESMAFAGHYLNGEDNCVELDFDDESEQWIFEIEDEDLRYLVMDQYEMWREWQAEYSEENEEA